MQHKKLSLAAFVFATILLFIGCGMVFSSIKDVATIPIVVSTFSLAAFLGVVGLCIRLDLLIELYRGEKFENL